MPRKRQGGQVPGRPGQRYPNRTDLQSQPNLPARVATGQTYGQAQSQLQAQKAVPMAAPALALPPAPVPQSGGPTAPPGAPGPSPQGAPGAGQQPFIAPGSMGDLHRPTERPNEPVTAGAPLGPGPGPSPMTSLTGVNNVSAVLAKAAQATNSSVLQQMAARAQAVGQ